MRYVLLTTVGKTPLIVGAFPTYQAAQIAVATLKISHPEYKGWKIVLLTGIRELKRAPKVTQLVRKVS